MLAIAMGSGLVQALETDTAMWVAVRINGAEQSNPILIERAAGGEILTSAADTDAWHLPALALVPDTRKSGAPMVKLRNRPGFRAELDEHEAWLDLTVAPWLYGPQVVALQEDPEPLRAAPLAMMVDYDLYATSVGDASGAAGASLAAGRFSVESTWEAGHAAGGGVRRLDTALRVSIPEKMAGVTIGDAVGGTMTTMRGVRFTGLRWNSDFSTQPDFLPFALPAVEGVAVVPSTVDMFVNGNYLATRSVGPGTFAVQDVPVPVGPGEVELRVVDSMGREQRITRRFLATPQLLRPGLVSHSLELGLLRRDYGLRDWSYGAGFGAFSIRRGMSTRTTLGVGAEVLQRQGTLRVEAIQRLSGADLVSAGMAIGGASGDTGFAGDLSWQHQGGRYEWGAELRATDGRYIDMAHTRDRRARITLASQFSIRVAARTSMGMSHVMRREDGRPGEHVWAFSVSSGPFGGGTVQAHVSRGSAGNGGTQLGIYYAIGFGRASAAMGVIHGRETQTSMRIGRGMDWTSGWGWDAAAHTGSAPYRALRLQAQSRRGSGEWQLVSRGSDTTVAGAWHGGLLLGARRLHWTPVLGESAALIELPDLAGVPVYHDGRLLGRTDTRGRLVVPDLRSYETNRIRIETSGVPIAAWLDVDALQLRPYGRNVYQLEFAASSSWAEFLLTTADGIAVPAGAQAAFGERSAVVGDSGLLVGPLLSGKAVEVSWTGGHCRARPEPAQLASARLGPVPLICH